MIGKTGLVVDSAAYLPQPLIDQHGILVAPLSVEIDGQGFLEGVDLTPDEFYERLPRARSVSTSQPSVGRILQCYEAAAAAGAERIISIHIGSGISGTVASAELAARSSPVPVTIVDTGQASFAEGLCAWEAIDALVGGATVEEAAACARAASKAVGNTFIARALDLMRRGGRLLSEGEAAVAGVPVLALTLEGIRPVGMATTLEEAVAIMAGHVHAAAEGAGGRELRVGVGHGAAPQIAGALRERIVRMQGVAEVIDYVVGPAVGAHTGAGTAGAVFLARPVVL